jgi:hypothetical protein
MDDQPVTPAQQGGPSGTHPHGATALLASSGTSDNSTLTTTSTSASTSRTDLTTVSTETASAAGETSQLYTNTSKSTTTPAPPKSFASAAATGDKDKPKPKMPLIFVDAPPTGWTEAIKTKVIKTMLLRLPANSVKQLDVSRARATLAVAAKDDLILKATETPIPISANLFLAVSSSVRPPRPASIKIKLANLPIGYDKEDIASTLAAAGAQVRAVVPDVLTLDGQKTSIWLTTAAVYVEPKSSVLPERILLGSRQLFVADPRDLNAAEQRKRAYELRQQRKREREQADNSSTPATAATASEPTPSTASSPTTSSDIDPNTNQPSLTSGSTAHEDPSWRSAPRSKRFNRSASPTAGVMDGISTRNGYGSLADIPDNEDGMRSGETIPSPME